MGSFGSGSVGSSGRYAKDAWKMGQQEFWNQAFRLDQDPFAKAGLRGLRYQAGKDWMGMGRAIGNQQADIASQGIQDALAARGGGNLASALGMGAQARSGAALQGLQTGAGMKSQFLSQLLGGAQAQLGLQNQLYGMLTGLSGSQIGAGAQIGAASIGSMGSLMGMLGGGGGAGGLGQGIQGGLSDLWNGISGIPMFGGFGSSANSGFFQ